LAGVVLVHGFFIIYGIRARRFIISGGRLPLMRGRLLAYAFVLLKL